LIQYNRGCGKSAHDVEDAKVKPQGLKVPYIKPLSTNLQKIGKVVMLMMLHSTIPLMMSLHLALKTIQMMKSLQLMGHSSF
jgi:hypothetical protein